MFGKINTVFAQSTLIQKYLFCCAVKGNEKKKYCHIQNMSSTRFHNIKEHNSIEAQSRVPVFLSLEIY